MNKKLRKDELLDLDEIRSAKVGCGEWLICGVYFLFSGDELIYVGQSVNVLARLIEHASKGFDSFAYVACSRDELDDIEAAYILKYSPRLNGNMGFHNRKCIPTTRGMDFLVPRNVISIDGLTRGQRTANRRDRGAYNAYQREYMRKRRASRS